MKPIYDFINAHWGSIAAASALVYAALVTSLPPTKKDFDLYGYFYSVTHSLLPVHQRAAVQPPKEQP